MATKRLKEVDVEVMDRTSMMEALEDYTPFLVTEIRKMTSKRMREQLMMIAQPRPKPKMPKVTYEPLPPPPVKHKRVNLGENNPMCLCNCGEQTKGGRFRPGHDARYHSAQKGPSKHAPKKCKCGCGGMTKGGTFRPGHDARYLKQHGSMK